MIPIRFNKVAFMVLAISVLLLAIAYINAQKKNKAIQVQVSSYAIQIDSLKAENKLLSSQSDYLIKYFDSTRKKIPQLKGFAFIADSIQDPQQP